MTTQLVLLALLVLGVGVKLHDVLERAPERALSGLLLSCLALLAVGQALSLPDVTDALDATTAAGVGKLFYNAATMLGLYTLVAFFARALMGAAPSRRRLRADGAALALVVAALAALMIATPQPLRSHSLTSPYLGYPTVAWFYLVGNGYFVYAYLTCGFWTWQYARRTAGYLATALKVIALGLVGVTVTSLVRATWVAVQYLRGPELDWVNSVNFRINNVSFLALTAGLLFLALVQAIPAVRTWLTQRRQFRALLPLWSTIAAAYPELVLDRAHNENTALPVAPRARRQRFYRRVVECRDGLLRLGPWMAPLATDRDLQAESPTQIASYIDEAIRRQQQRGDPADEAADDAVSVAIPTTSDARADVDQLIAISDALQLRRHNPEPASEGGGRTTIEH